MRINVSNNDTDEVSGEKRKELITELFYMLALGWVVVTYFAQPFLKFINPFLLLAIGCSLSAIMFILRTKVALPYIKQPLSKKLITFSILIFFVLIVLSAVEGIYNYATSQVICTKLQKDIVNKTQDFDKSATAFSALSCQYNGYMKYLDFDNEKKTYDKAIDASYL